jgi:hypothetical protein
VSLDFANAFFELLASIFGWLSVWELFKKKTVSGVFAPGFILSAVWAICSLPYYHVHQDYLSAAVCATRAAAYAAWSCMWLHFSLQPKRKSKPTLVWKNPNRFPRVRGR